MSVFYFPIVERPIGTSIFDYGTSLDYWYTPVVRFPTVNAARALGLSLDYKGNVQPFPDKFTMNLKAPEDLEYIAKIDESKDSCTMFFKGKSGLIWTFGNFLISSWSLPGTTKKISAGKLLGNTKSNLAKIGILNDSFSDNKLKNWNNSVELFDFFLNQSSKLGVLYGNPSKQTNINLAIPRYLSKNNQFQVPDKVEFSQKVLSNKLVLANNISLGFCHV